jgi:hypothetical protein
MLPIDSYRRGRAMTRSVEQTGRVHGATARGAGRLGFLLPFALLACIPMSLGPGQQPWDPPVVPARAQPLTAREDCADRDVLRRAYFGDLHVHTAFSMDARVGDPGATPNDAYRFARGESIGLPPLDAHGNATRTAKLDRPLDFAAVTDHAEWLGETSLCTRPGSPSYESKNCRIFRGEAQSWIPGLEGLGARMSGVVGMGARPEGVCGEDAVVCRAEVGSVWQTTRDAAERWYDRTAACEFTTFQAWEYSASPGRSKVHRNVILRNEIAPELPVSWLDEPDVRGLWRRLKELCIDTGTGCDALSIPHNPNLSNGRMFTPTYRDLPVAEQRAEASLRAELEPLVEMMQIKGESECRNGMFGVVGEVDELCDFEKLRGLAPGPEDCREDFGSGATEGKGCVSRLDYARYVLTEGLREEARIGVNPYRLGFIGSTDNHNATPGDADEYAYAGNDGAEDATSQARLSTEPGFAGAAPVQLNPGGLVGVWAEENSRDALFDAMERRETFATSGTRILPRFFGGWEYPDDLCESSDWVAESYATGVAMGGDLLERPANAQGPTFVVSALRDAGTAAMPGTALQRIQIIKGWVGADGLLHQAVVDVIGEPENGADVDPLTCAPRGPGADSLCTVWRDPGFDPERRAVYYARVVENPSCRWHTRQCLALPESDRPAGCDDPRVPRVIQERAWTSAIWYSPS